MRFHSCISSLQLSPLNFRLLFSNKYDHFDLTRKTVRSVCARTEISGNGSKRVEKNSLRTCSRIFSWNRVVTILIIPSFFSLLFPVLHLQFSLSRFFYFRLYFISWRFSSTTLPHLSILEEIATMLQAVYQPSYSRTYKICYNCFTHEWIHSW